MRNHNIYGDRPKERELIRIGTEKRAWAFIRTDIEERTVTDAEGNERKEWTAIEYSTQINALTEDFQITDALVEKIIEKERVDEAKAVREKRNELLAETDAQMMPDRTESGSERYEAWAAYRQALRDLTKQSGFPFEVEWPEKPVI